MSRAHVASVLLLLEHAKVFATSSGSLLSASLLCFPLNIFLSKAMATDFLIHLIQGPF